MQANSYSKYVLRDLHEAIDLFDRKIDYCQTHEKFETVEERAKAFQKLCSKRDALIKTALALHALGVETDRSYLPRSFKAAVDAGNAMPLQAAGAGETRRRVTRK